ncbi:MAG TPA: AMP-binding protein, partial [Fibrobacteria bacterium]|nr:AMP-binding protein [Fibrobacteria bacterium]
HRSPVAYAGIQAIAASGAAFVPLHPTSPVSHNARIRNLSGFDTLIVGPECAEAFVALLPHLDKPLRVVTLGSIDRIRTALSERPEFVQSIATIDPLAPVTEPATPFDGTAYIIFTSGSTGMPKGVQVTHSNLRSYLDSYQSLYPILPEDRYSELSDLTFDLSVHDQYVTWQAGATLVVFPDRFNLKPLDYARERGVTVWCSVPAIPTFLESFGLAIPGALPKIRLSLFAGEKLTWNALQTWRKIAPNTRCVNLYGPTEATVVLTHYEVPSDLAESDCFQGGICLGRTFPGQRIEVRRPDGSLCQPMEEGSLWLAGDQVTPGYLDPEKTAERFVLRDGVVWYRTGDLGFLDDRGNYQFIGREDFQVKVMGYRIELGEIEAALLRETGAPWALADVARLRGDMDEIVCVLPAAFASRKKALREGLKNRLEPHMLPKIWKFQDELPLNANGKIDRGALKAQWIAQAKEE